MNRITPKAVNNEQQLDRRIKEIERQVQSFPVRNVGGGAVSIRWLRIDGGQELNASPKIDGITWGAGADPAPLPAALDPGAVDPVTGAETTAPTGTFPDRVGYGSIITESGGSFSYVRTLVFMSTQYGTSGRGVLKDWVIRPGPVVTIADDALGEKSLVSI